MPTIQTFNVTLPDDIAKMIEHKIASGEYASESDVINAGLRVLQDRDTDFETWLRTEAAASFDEYHADPSTAIPSDQIMDVVRESYRSATTKVNG